MKEEEQRIAIAEACGWKRRDDLDFSVYGDTLHIRCWEKDGLVRHLGGIHEIPDYLNDLNAMHDVVQPYLYEQAFWNVFTDHLKAMDKECEGWNTTASQRAEAFLKTLNLWKD